MQVLREKEVILSEVRQTAIMMEPYLAEVFETHKLPDVAYALHDMLDNDMYIAMVVTISRFESRDIDTSTFDYAKQLIKFNDNKGNYKEHVRGTARTYISDIGAGGTQYLFPLCAAMLHLRLLEKTNNGEKKK